MLERIRLILLALGGLCLSGSAIYTANHLDDNTAFAVLVPGFLIGLVLVVVSLRLDQTN